MWGVSGVWVEWGVGYACERAYVRARACVRVRACVCVCVRARARARACVCMCVCVCVCDYARAAMNMCASGCFLYDFGVYG